MVNPKTITADKTMAVNLSFFNNFIPNPPKNKFIYNNTNNAPLYKNYAKKDFFASIFSKLSIYFYIPKLTSEVLFLTFF